MLAIALLWLIVAANQVRNVDGSVFAGRRLSLEQLEQLLSTGFERLAFWVDGYARSIRTVYMCSASLNHSFCTNYQYRTCSPLETE